MLVKVNWEGGGEDEERERKRCWEVWNGKRKERKNEERESWMLEKVCEEGGGKIKNEREKDSGKDGMKRGREESIKWKEELDTGRVCKEEGRGKIKKWKEREEDAGNYGMGRGREENKEGRKAGC